MHNRILIVDDEEINQELAKMIVVSKGFEVDIASNGEQAVDAVSRNERFSEGGSQLSCDAGDFALGRGDWRIVFCS